MLIKYVFGLSPQYDGIWVHPAENIPFESSEFQIKAKNCNLNISYQEVNKVGRKFYVNKQQRSGVFDGVMMLEKVWITEEELNCHDISIEIID